MFPKLNDNTLLSVTVVCTMDGILFPALAAQAFIEGIGESFVEVTTRIDSLHNTAMILRA